MIKERLKIKKIKEIMEKFPTFTAPDEVSNVLI